MIEKSMDILLKVLEGRKGNDFFGALHLMAIKVKNEHESEVAQLKAQIERLESRRQGEG